jgi:hypothetical protein
MSSYFGAGHHDWQSSELPHFTTTKVCSTPYNTSAPLSNGYQSYHSAHQTAYVMTPSPPVPRYVSSGGADHSHPHNQLHNRFENSVAFPHHPQHHLSHTHHSLQHHSHHHHSHALHPHPDHVFTGGTVLSGPTGAATAPIQAPVQFHSMGQHSTPTGVHSIAVHGHSVTNLLQSESLLQDSSSGSNRVVTPEQISGTPHNSNSVSHQHQLYSSNQSPASCKLSASHYETNSSIATATTRSASTTDESPAYDSPPPTTPELTSINGQLNQQQHHQQQQNQNNKHFFPWMKSYTGKFFLFKKKSVNKT